MVIPSWLSRTILLGGLGAATLATAGCGFVPEGRLGECHKMSRTLQAENARLRDQALTFRNQNQELTLRAVDDGRQIQELEEANAHYEQSVMAYQKDIARLSSAVDRFKNQVETVKSQVRVSEGAAEAPLSEQARLLAERRPGVAFDGASMAFGVPVDSLFEPGSDRLTADGQGWLREVAGLLTGPQASGLRPRVIAPADPAPAVRRVAVEDSGESRARQIGMARATRVGDLLATAAGLDRAILAVVPAEGTHAFAGSSTGTDATIQIQLHGPDAATPIGGMSPNAKAVAKAGP
jgi:chemotaxis protein MotB